MRNECAKSVTFGVGAFEIQQLMARYILDQLNLNQSHMKRIIFISIALFFKILLVSIYSSNHHIHDSHFFLAG